MSHQDIIQTLIEWIDEHIDQPLNIDVVARKSGYSKWYLQRMFRAVMHQTLGDYIRQRRLLLRAGLGLSLGMATQTSTSVPALAMTEPIWEPTLGVHWRAPLGGNMFLDLSTWTRAPYRSQTPDAMDMIWLNRQPNYGTRVEVQWASPRFGGLLPEFGAIGVKLEGDSQLLLRTRSGGPMLYYRTKF